MSAPTLATAPSGITGRTTNRRVTVLIPRPAGLFGPVTGARLRRTGLVMAAFWAIGLALTLLPVPTAWRAAGAGLQLPGGSLLYAGHPVYAVLAAVGLLLSVFFWWAMGPIVLPPLVWAATIAAGALVAEHRPGAGRIAFIAAVVPLAVAAGLAWHVSRHRRTSAAGARLNERLADEQFLIVGPPAPAAGLPVAESSPEDLAHLRYALDLALQPIDEFQGFLKLDQFREAALRYQLTSLGYALSMAQFTRTPAFAGYHAEAQRNLIEKMLQPPVWRYWGLENTWGNLDRNADPIDTDENVMLTGFWGVAIGMYATLNDTRYSSPGALTFRDGDREYRHDFTTIAGRCHRNVLGSDFALFPCEPNWIYSICNTFGLNTQLSHDRLHGTRYAAESAPRLRASMDAEFTRPDGRIVGMRSEHLGLTWNLWAGEAIQTPTAYFMHAGLPEIAQRTWWLLREQALTIRDGQLQFPRGTANRLDPGNYKLGRDTFAQVSALMAAREVGDEEYARAAERTLAEREPCQEKDGARRYTDASLFCNAYGLLGRFGRHGGLRDLVAYGVPDAWQRGPRLNSAAYPEVLVARAVTDGAGLNLVLRPGAGPVRTTLGIDRLVPHGHYAVHGAHSATLVADATGQATLSVDLGGRTEIRLTPHPTTSP
jgi:hypothetical protein